MTSFYSTTVQNGFIQKESNDVIQVIRKVKKLICVMGQVIWVMNNVFDSSGP